jgi:hypothetical protein
MPAAKSAPSIDALSKGVAVAAYAIIVWWTYDLERQCTCSAGWKRDFIRYGFLLAAAANVGTYFITTVYQTPALLLGLLVLALYIVTITYITDLKKKKCACSEGWKRDFSYTLPVFSIGMSLAVMLYAVLYWDTRAVMQMRQQAGDTSIRDIDILRSGSSGKSGKSGKVRRAGRSGKAGRR